MAIPSQERFSFHIYTAQQRPHLLKSLAEPDHPLNLLWPDFLGENLTFKEYIPKLADIESLRRFQFLAVEEDSLTGEEQIIGLAQSVPFYWQELSALGPGEFLFNHPKILVTLPDGGHDTILSLGVQQALTRQVSLEARDLTIDQQPCTRKGCSSQRPNALSALSISVRKDRRNTGLAETFILKMKQTAMDEKFQAMVVPLRPTQKFNYPLIDMAEYIQWKGSTSDRARLDLDRAPNSPDSFSPDSFQETQQQQILPFDPWLRKHLRLGGRIVKVAPHSMMVRGTAEQWGRWTGVDFDLQTQEQDLACSHSDYKNVVIPGGLVPVRYNKKEKVGVYVEPNVWVFHELRE